MSYGKYLKLSHVPKYIHLKKKNMSYLKLFGVYTYRMLFTKIPRFHSRVDRRSLLPSQYQVHDRYH